MKATKRPGVGDAKTQATQRLNVRVTPDAYERLLLHAIKAKRSPGDLIVELIESHLRQWRVQENPASRGKVNDRPESVGPVIESAPALPLQDAA